MKPSDSTDLKNVHNPHTLQQQLQELAVFSMPSNSTDFNQQILLREYLDHPKHIHQPKQN